MPDRCVGLIRARQGPWIYTGRHQTVALEVSGLNGVLCVEQSYKPDATARIMRITENGRHTLERFPWTRMLVIEGNHLTVMALIHGKAA